MGRHFQRGQVLFELEPFSEAAAEYLKELAESPEFYGAHLNLAASLYHARDIRGAELALRNAIELAPEFDHSLCLKSYVTQAYGRRKDSLDAVVEAIRLEPKCEYFHRLSETHDWLGNPGNALQATTASLELDPQYVPSILLRGRQLREVSRLDEASNPFISALRINPNAAEAQQEMGRFQLTQGHATEALDFLKEARRLAPLAANDREKIAEAYGLGLPLYRTANRFVVRWHLWSFHWQWLLAVVLTLVFCTASLLQESKTLQNPLPQGSFLWWLSCMLLANYLILPYSLVYMARATGMVLVKKELDLRWQNLLTLPFCFVGAILLHMLITIVGSVISSSPELFAMATAFSTNRPTLLSIGRSKRGLMEIIPFMFPLVFMAVFSCIGVVAITYGRDWELGVPVIITCFIVSYFFHVYTVKSTP